MSEKTVYLITGGPSTDREQLVRDIRAALQTVGKPNPTVAYVGTASLDSASFFRYLRGPLLKAGAGEVTLAPIVGRSDTGEAEKLLSGADAVFLTGGEVEDGIVWLRRTGLDALLTRLYREGKLFFGISAGCIMMGQNWVHWDREDDDSTASLFPCLGFLPMTFDAHGEAEDWKELKCALRLMGPGSVGFGLSDGGFYTVENGRLRSFRNGPEVFRNTSGNIAPEDSRIYRV